jgi:hypothetical protein
VAQYSLFFRNGLPKQRNGYHIESLLCTSYADSVRKLRGVHAELCELAIKVNLFIGVRLLVDITAQLLALLLRLKIVIIWVFNTIRSARVNVSTSLETNEDAMEMERALHALVLCPIHVGTVYAVVFYCVRTVRRVMV